MKEKPNKQKTTAKADKALKQLSKGEKTINQIRKDFDLEPLNDDEFNKKTFNQRLML